MKVKSERVESIAAGRLDIDIIGRRVVRKGSKNTIQTSEHGDNAQDHLLDTLYGAPAFRGLFIHRRIITWSVQDRDADVSVRIY